MKKIIVVCLVLFSFGIALAQETFVLKDTGATTGPESKEKVFRVYNKVLKPAAADEKPVLILEDQGSVNTTQLNIEKGAILNQIQHHNNQIASLQNRIALIDAILAKAASMEVVAPAPKSAAPKKP